MKNLFVKNTTSFLVAIMFVLLQPVGIYAQGFQKAFGNSLDNSFSNVIQDGNFYYVLGSNESTEGALPNATITRLNSMGEQMWTKRLNIPSEWYDAVRKPDGSLLVVGSTLPANESSKSLMGSISQNGVFDWVNSYDVTGHEKLSKIIQSPLPQNPLFEYYAVGTQLASTGNPDEDDFFLLNLDGDGDINWKKYMPGFSDEDLANDLEVMANGNLLLAGSIGTNGTILVLDNTGQLVNAASPEAGTFSYHDLALANDGSIYGVGRLQPSLLTLLMKYDIELIPQWEVSILGLTDISQVWEDPATEDVFVTARGVFDGKSRPVIIRITNTEFDPAIAWVKYLDNGETSYAGGTTALWHIRWICYTDSRVNPVSGFGESCAFISISDLDLNTCITESASLELETFGYLYNSPDLPPMEFYDEPQGTPVANSMLIWQEQDVCGSDPCMAEFVFNADCSQVSFFDQSILPNAPSWSWTFSGGNPATSSAQNPVVNFPTCGDYEVCLTLTSNDPNDDCTSTFCHNIEIVDLIPPTVSCSGVSVEFDANCEAFLLPSFVGAAFDNCQIQSTSVFPNIITSCGFTPVTFTATDWCGNTATCETSVYALELTPPVIVCPTDIVVNTPSMSPCSIAVHGLHWISATDACGIKTIVYDITGATVASGINDPSGLIFNQGVSTVTYTATDNCDNTASCSFKVTVVCESEICCPEFSLIQLIDIMPCNDSTCMGDTSSQFPMQGAISTIVACKNSVQTYYVIPNLPGFIYTWTVTGGTLTSTQGNNPGVITWGSGNQGFINVIIMDAAGTCRDTLNQKVCLIDAPVAAFTVSPGITICSNQQVSFTNISIGGSSYLWDFGDGTSSTTQNPPPHNYALPGTYTVLLSVSNSMSVHVDFKCGCTDTATVKITVLAGDGPTITPSGCQRMFCPGDTASYCVTPACSPYTWIVNGGTIINNNGSCITVKWNTNPPSTYPSSVSVTTGCVTNCGNSATLNVPVLWPNMPINGPSPVCIGSTESYSLPTLPGTFYTWTVTPGGTIIGPYINTPTINVQWNGPANPETITCTYDNPYSGCMGISIKPILVKDIFTILSGPTIVCEGMSPFPTYTSNGNANWTITPAGNTITTASNNVSSIDVNWIVPGIFTITATPPAGAYCNPNAVLQVVVNPAPVVNITGPLVVCPNQVYSYTASSNLPGGNFTWMVLGGGTASSYGPNNSNASVIFTGSGPWMLMATQKVNGCDGSSTIFITAEPVPTLPTISFSPCIGGQVTISVLPGSVGPYTWTSSPAASLINGQGTATATYEIHGMGTISVSNCGGPSNLINVTPTSPTGIMVTELGTLCAGNLQLMAPGGGPGTTYQWFGGSSATIQTIPVSLPGTYTVQVTFPGGCISATTHTVLPVAVPTVSISTGDPLGWCIPGTPTVNLQAFTLGSGCTFQWYDVLNGLIPGEVNSTYQATSFGSFYVVVMCGGCVATSNIITVYQITCVPPPGTCIGVPNPLGPITGPSGMPIIMCNPISFEVSVTGCPGANVSWNFGDGTPSIFGTNSPGVNSISHTYAHPGAYLVTASIVCNGCAFLVYTNVNVPVTAHFLSSVVCGANGSNTITLTDASQVLGGWTIANPTDITWTSTCGNPSSFTGNMYTLNTTSFCTTPTVTMNITVTNLSTGNTCTVSKMMPFNLPSAALTINGPSLVCKNKTYQFTSSMTALNNIVQYEWTVNGVPVSQVNPLEYAFDGNPVNPVIGLTVKNSFGCTFSTSRTVNVVMPRPLSISPVSICPDCLPPASLTATPASGFTNYQWYQNGTIISGANSATYQLCAPGNYYVTAEDFQTNSCDVISNTVQVVYFPKPDANIHGASVLCVPSVGPYTFQMNNVAGSNFNYSYNWTATGSGTITFSPDNLQYYTYASVTQIGTYQFILKVTDLTTGCMALDTLCVYLFQNPMVIVTGPSGILCEGTPYTFTATATPPANYVYQWSNGASGASMTTSLPGSYSVTATNPESGCYGIGYTGVIRPLPPTILFPEGCDTICDNETITPPLPLGGSWPTNLSQYTIQWFFVNNSTPFYTGPVLSLSGTLPPLVYGWNDIYIIVTYNGCSSTSNVYSLFIKKCCECTSSLGLSSGDSNYIISCDPHVGFIPSLPCPANDVFIGGPFGFADPNTGEICTETPVKWTLLLANNSTISGTTTNYSSFIFPKQMVEPPGTYCLTLTTISPNGQDTCTCIVKWIQEPCACCTTLEDFCSSIMSNVILTVDNNYCKATLDIGSLNGCNDYIEWVDWNYPSVQQGPFLPGTMPMHTYTASGTYSVCYLAVERDINGFVCFEKVICDTITVVCPSCYCGTFSGLFYPFTRIILGTPLVCGENEVAVECPPPGHSMHFTGNFQCAGTSCPPTAQVSWKLYRLPDLTTPVATGSTTANPYFSISILPAYYAIAGSYQLHLTGHCGPQECPCIVKFRVNCPEPCPCDVPTLNAAVAQGFAESHSNVSCRSCFSPIALSDCETVKWYLNTTGGMPIGTSVGNNTFCYTFSGSGSGSYTVIMVVNRKKSDGSDCGTSQYSKTVNITCLIRPVCRESVFLNPTFSEGADAGDLGAGGKSQGWTSILGKPKVIEGYPGSDDGITMQLWGNHDTSSVLIATESVCLAKDTGNIKLRIQMPLPRTQTSWCKILFVQSDNVELNNCNGIDCYEVASISLSELNASEWYEIQVPYNLSQWMSLNSCAGGSGVMVKPVVYITNFFTSEQGGEDTYSVVQVDNFCVDGTIVAVNNVPINQNIRIYPNPISEKLNIELPYPARSGMSMQVVNLTGQVLMEKKVEVGKVVQTIEANTIVDGMYLLQIISDGRILAVNKFVKM